MIIIDDDGIMHDVMRKKNVIDLLARIKTEINELYLNCREEVNNENYYTDEIEKALDIIQAEIKNIRT